MWGAIWILQSFPVPGPTLGLSVARKVHQEYFPWCTNFEIGHNIYHLRFLELWLSIEAFFIMPGILGSPNTFDANSAKCWYSRRACYISNDAIRWKSTYKLFTEHVSQMIQEYFQACFWECFVRLHVSFYLSLSKV